MTDRPYRSRPLASSEMVIDAKHAAAIRRAFPVVHMHGYALMERPELRYDEVLLDKVAKVALVGEVRHLVYQVDMESIKAAMRRDLEATLVDFAERVGVDWTPR